MSIGANIQRLRKEARMTQPELAEKLGVHETTIRRWEQGKDRGPDVEMVDTIAKVFNTSTDYLLSNHSDFEEKFSTNTKNRDRESMASISLGGDKNVTAPATPEGYAFLERALLIAMNAQNMAAQRATA